VTAGAASACARTAACVTMGKRSAVRSIPNDVTGLKTEVIVQKAPPLRHYDHGASPIAVSASSKSRPCGNTNPRSTIAR